MQQPAHGLPRGGCWSVALPRRMEIDVAQRIQGRTSFTGTVSHMKREPHKHTYRKGPVRSGFSVADIKIGMSDRNPS